MKILYLATNYSGTGGKEQYDRNVLTALKDAGEDVSVVKLNRPFLILKIAFVIESFFKAILNRPDYVFCSHISFAPLGFYIKRILGVPYMVFTHGLEVWDIKNESWKNALKNARLVITVSNFTAQKLMDQLPELHGKIFILRNSVDGDKFSIAPKPEYLVKRHNLEDKKVILSVTRLYPVEERKGYLKVIDALPRIKQVFPNVSYIIAGEGARDFGDNRERIKAYAQDIGVDSNVILTGRVADAELVDYYNLCDVFVLPSTLEGFGIVFTEALASGKPVIAGNKDGSQEAVLNGELGLLVDPNSPEEIGKAILRVLGNQAPAHMYDREYLRRKVLAAYGPDEFKKSASELLRLLRS